MKFQLKFIILFGVAISTFCVKLTQTEVLNDFCRRKGDCIICEGIIFGENTQDYDVFNFGRSCNNCSIEVYMSHIPILHTGVFRHWFGVTSVQLPNIGLTRIGSPIKFEQADRLHKLDLSYNKLTVVPAGVFGFLVGLQLLDLTKNKLTELEGYVFEGLSNLKYLNLRGNGLKSLSENVFAELKELENLDLSENAISDYSVSMFSHNANLVYLDLSAGFSIHIPISSMIEHLKKLQFLDISQNHVYLQIKSFAEMQNLTFLNLSSTGLREYLKEFGYFTYTKKLQVLDLSNNTMSSCVTKTFAFLSNLTAIYLHENQLDSIDYNVFESNRNLRRISLSNNNWSCDFLTDMLKYFYHRNTTIDFSRSHLVKDSENVEGIRCQRPIPSIWN